MRNALILLPAVLALSACSSQPPRASQPMVQAGEPVNCIQTNRIRSTNIVDDQTIDFRMSNGTIYRNTLPNRCPGLRPGDAFSYRTTQSRLCRIDVIRVINTTGGPRFGASCGLGQFVPVKPADVPETRPAG